MSKKEDKEFAKMWQQQLSFVEHSINDPKLPKSVRGILSEWLSFKGKELLDEYNKDKKQ